MKIVKAYVAGVWVHLPEGFDDLEKWLESIARTCYKSEDKITEESASRFVRMLRDRGHHAMLEHAFVTARLVGDRGASHEEVRHRLASFAQESTRYCNYSKGKFNNEINVVEQPDLVMTHNPAIMSEWMDAMEDAERHYMKLIELGAPVGGARSVLPIALKAEIVFTANLREWMHVFELRHNKAAHSIICQIMGEVENQLHGYTPNIFEGRHLGLVELSQIRADGSYTDVLRKFGWESVESVWQGTDTFSTDNGEFILVHDDGNFRRIKRGEYIPVYHFVDGEFVDIDASYPEISLRRVRLHRRK